MNKTDEFLEDTAFKLTPVENKNYDSINWREPVLLKPIASNYKTQEKFQKTVKMKGGNCVLSLTA